MRSPFGAAEIVIDEWAGDDLERVCQQVVERLLDRPSREAANGWPSTVGSEGHALLRSERRPECDPIGNDLLDVDRLPAALVAASTRLRASRSSVSRVRRSTSASAAAMSSSLVGPAARVLEPQAHGR